MAQHLLGDIKSMLEEGSPELISNKATWACLTETVEFSKLSSEEKAEILVHLNEIE